MDSHEITDDLIDGMIPIVFGEIDLTGVGDWMPAARQRAISLLEVLLRDRWAVSLMESRPNPRPANLRHHDANLGSVRAASFAIEMAARAYSLLNIYIYSFAQTQLNLPCYAPEEIAEIGEEMLRHLQRDIMAKGSFLVLKATAPVLIKQGMGGDVIYISTTGGDSRVGTTTI